MSNEFEKYPVLTEHIREYASFGHFSNWSSFLAELNQALAKGTPPPPASAEKEAARLYPDEATGMQFMTTTNEIATYQRSAHITCAGMYTGEISRLKTLFKEFWDSNVAEPCKRQGASEGLIEKHWQEFKAKHNL